MHLVELWRYPVKSLAGERLEEAELGPGGIVGDRLFQVRRADGRIVDARAHPRLLALHPHLSSGGGLLIDGEPWDAPEIARAVEAAAAVGPGAHLVRSDGVDRFDVLPLLVATDGAIAAFGRDRRRLRPNLLIGGVVGLAEREWAGHALRIGEASIGVLDLRARCVMTTYDPDTQVQDSEVLEQIYREFGGRIALDCWVIRGGRIRVGDTVELAGRAMRPPDEMWGRYAPAEAPRKERRPPTGRCDVDCAESNITILSRSVVTTTTLYWLACARGCDTATSAVGALRRSCAIGTEMS